MYEHLVGYLLRSLDPETHREVEQHLKRDPEARRQLDRLRQALAPLEVDVEPEPPPDGLWLRTLAHVAHQRCHRPDTSADAKTIPFRGLPTAPKPARSETGSPTRPSWRWIDVAAAAVILLVAGALVIVWLGRSWREQIQVACQNNLRNLYTALTIYSDKHNGDYPRISDTPPTNVASSFAPLLHDEGVLPDGSPLRCPGHGQQPDSLPSLEALKKVPPEQFYTVAQTLGGGYAYSLGYHDANQLVGLRRSDSRVPILSDRPLVLKDGKIDATVNSPNHAGRGQNVLFTDGSVEFLTQPALGAPGDHLFLNHQGRVAAGLHRLDSVLGAGAAQPIPLP
jgi:hypothetical protein